MSKKFPGVGDHRAAVGSEEYILWLDSLPKFLRDVVAEARGITITAAVMRTPQNTGESTTNGKAAV